MGKVCDSGLHTALWKDYGEGKVFHPFVTLVIKYHLRLFAKGPKQ
jgi:hypothetical protein